MRVIFVATASVALALEGADHPDSEEYLSLLQVSARPHSVAEDLDVLDVDDLDSAGQGPGQGNEDTTPITWDTQRSYGPDGTWATPFCPHVEGCLIEESFCPAGCDGTAFWHAMPYENPKDYSRSHFIGCLQGQNKAGGAFGNWKVFRGPTRYQNCLNGPDSKKPAVWNNVEGAANMLKWKLGLRLSMPVDMTMSAYGNEYCPTGCVNDCAYFKLGNFLSCGSRSPLGWQGYNGQNTKDVGPNPRCPLGSVARRGEGMMTWCGEPTTTTTTPPPPPADDEADAAGDPHIGTNTGQHFDLQ